MKEWAHKMVSGRPGGEAADFEKWAESIAKQLKVTVETMTQSLRIKEDAYNKMFSDKCNALELPTKNQEMVRKAQLTMQNVEGKKIESDAKLVLQNVVTSISMKLNVSEMRMINFKECLTRNLKTVLACTRNGVMQAKLSENSRGKILLYLLM